MLTTVLISPNMQIDINIPELNPEMVRVCSYIYILYADSQRTLLVLTLATSF
jgi:hypothetical protein